MPVDRHPLFEDGNVTAAEVFCRHPPRDWTPVVPVTVFGLAIVRRGLFVGEVDGVEQVLDPATVYVERPGSEHRFAHPCGEDTYTEIVLSEAALAGLLGGDPTVPPGPVFTTPRVAVQQRLLAARARQHADAFELGELTVALAGELLAALAPERLDSGLPVRAAARRRIVDGARSALAEDHRLSLTDLARLVGCSPYHLSRIFRAVTGEGLARYRNRLRVTLALDRLSEGETELAALAHDLGFTDQAHMTHAVRRLVGLTPGAVRELFRPAAG